MQMFPLYHYLADKPDGMYEQTGISQADDNEPFNE